MKTRSTMGYLWEYLLILGNGAVYSGKTFINNLITGIIVTMMLIVMGLLQHGIFTSSSVIRLFPVK